MIFRLFITPQTNIHITQRDRICFAIPDEKLQAEYPQWYKRKLRIIKYLQYKKNLREEAARVGFILPTDGAWIKFYMPMPHSWSKKKKLRMDFQPHQSRPDTSNLYKAMEDSLREQDMIIWDVRISKFWYSSVKGYIEVTVPQANVDMAAIAAMQIKPAKNDVLQ